VHRKIIAASYSGRTCFEVPHTTTLGMPGAYHAVETPTATVT
jgi:hypothetical protein